MLRTEFQYAFAFFNSLTIATIDFVMTDGYDPLLSESCQTPTIHTWIVPLAVWVMTFFYVAINLVIAA